MNRKYKQLTEQDRIFLRVMLEKHYPKSKIAQTLGVDPSTIYREIKRNSCIHEHSGQKSYTKLKLGWSPYQIEGRLKIENEGQCLISHETIYQYIYSSYDRRNRYYSHLRRKHLWRIKRGSRKPRIPKELLITARPQEINDRSEFGHWEGDVMIFKRGIKANLITF